MTTIYNRIVAGAVLITAPVVIALSTATAGHAQPGTHTNPGPIVSSPEHHPAFPHQDFSIATPGTWEHHHHQWRRGW